MRLVSEYGSLPVDLDLSNSSKLFIINVKGLDTYISEEDYSRESEMEYDA